MKKTKFCRPNFKEGDIIIEGNKVYVCKIAGEAKALFSAMAFEGFFGATCVSCCGYFEKKHPWQVKCNGRKTLHINPEFYDHPDKGYPSGGFKRRVYNVIGYYDTGSGRTMFNFSILKCRHPEVFKGYIKYWNKKLKKKAKLNKQLKKK